jgi:hypothetical protein
VVFTGLVGNGLTLIPAAPAVTPTPASWSGLPHAIDPATLADDALWWAQVCHDPHATTSAVWQSQGRPVPPVRFEQATCAGRVRAEFVAGAGTDVQWLGEAKQAAGSYLLIPPDTTGAGAELVVVVGDRDVVAIDVKGRRFPGRTLVRVVSGPGPVDVVDRMGVVHYPAFASGQGAPG